MPRRKTTAQEPTALEALQKSFQMTLPRDLAHKVALYHSALQQAGVGGTLRDTIRELVTVGLSSSDPETLPEILVGFDRIQTMLKTKQWLLTKTHRFADELQREIELELGLNPTVKERG
ncbi:MAG: hypothetical protein KJ887_07255 [Candidatus Omnitrophica bacterium]|nr:hypothetical protein [Candidatus Omnitrophota bacterium]MBU1048363.1 hypothetical protein [Candidatus Omnitrophota bacterium]MBU1767843.1 hypothetical protein [Candidatus Omnitrophota bacterium]